MDEFGEDVVEPHQEGSRASTKRGHNEQGVAPSAFCWPDREGCTSLSPDTWMNDSVQAGSPGEATVGSSPTLMADVAPSRMLLF